MRKLWLIATLLAGCVVNPYTGRSQFIVIDEASEKQMGVQAYQEVLGKQRLSSEPAEVDPVRRVGQRIAAAADRKDFQWEFNVIIDDHMLNAWCMPGGKICFYTGIYPVLQDEAGMAFVMGHEVSHALLRHGAERMSQGMLAELGGGILGAAVGARDPETQKAVLALYGAGVQYGALLPFSREHESEADLEGLKLMARAGYDPCVSVEVWKRMTQLGGAQPPEFLSTHPSHETRIRDLEAHTPEALAIYEKSGRASVAALPAIPGNRKGIEGQAGAGLVAPSGSVSVSALRSQRGALKDGHKAVLFEFSFNGDVYLESIRIAGPKESALFEIKSGVPGGAKKIVTLQRKKVTDPDFDRGHYELTFEGRTSGYAFTVSCSYTVP